VALRDWQSLLHQKKFAHTKRSAWPCRHAHFNMA